jgi:hypothetical protein
MHNHISCLAMEAAGTDTNYFKKKKETTTDIQLE